MAYVTKCSAVLRWGFSAACLFVACEVSPPATSRSATSVTPAPATSPAALNSGPNYAGTYAVQDTAVCQLSITVKKQASSYTYSYAATQGLVEVTREGSDTYFTFIGLKGQDPEEDVSAVWQDSVLLIQNSGNSMNEYTRFGSCDAKYLELWCQR